LQLEMSFLIERYQQLTKIFAEPNIFSHFIITDYMLKKCLLFAKINLSKQEFKLYHSFFNLIYKKLPKPDIIFYLHSDTETLLRNIKRRGRDYEQSISKVYLNKIERMYFEYFRQNPENKFVIVDINGVDWISNVFAYEKLKEVFSKEYNVGMNFIKLHNDNLLELPL
ncbi:MAG TPA: deoxynucleoside kinase, partial [Chitinophagales bacterium]|nr:deoxynucleoside kinase [Chitinophagales bacterium]